MSKEMKMELLKDPYIKEVLMEELIEDGLCKIFNIFVGILITIFGLICVYILKDLTVILFSSVFSGYFIFFKNKE